MQNTFHIKRNQHGKGMSMKVSVCINLEQILTHPVAVAISLGCICTLESLAQMFFIPQQELVGWHSWAPRKYCFSHHSLKLAVNLILDIWGSQCLHCQPLKTVIHNLTCSNVSNC
jgi:hypothetical protein